MADTNATTTAIAATTTTAAIYEATKNKKLQDKTEKENRKKVYRGRNLAMADVTNTTAAAAATATTTAAMGDAANNGKTETQKKNRIQVSNTKKPLFFYLNLAKRYMKLYDDVELSALGMAIPTVVIIAEILKSNGLATEKKVLTSTIDFQDDAKGRLVQKPKIEILLMKSENGDKLKTNTAGTASWKIADKKEQNK
ncbi:unnamed protein product [Ilex paraguariensis]|uniref:DNA/RNA-binding protein Alba-like domain-containing protein n=1 Tax=Ilex paraguariensis TaxID=185542 RepID=A0ABC8TLX3_9AQUA